MAGPQERMLAVVVPLGEQAWFFKLTGPRDAVGTQAEAFQSLIKSLKFKDGKPQWTLPAGWREKPGNEMRYATLELDAAGKTLEVSVTSLTLMGMGEAEYVLANVNRWRGQMQLPPIRAEEVGSSSQTFKLAEGVATLVDLARGPGAGTGHPPMSPPGAAGPPAGKPPAPTGTAASGAGALQVKVPEGWKPGPLEVTRGGISLRHEAAFEVRDGDQRVEITVDKLTGGGDLQQNAARWCQQVGLPAISAEELNKQRVTVEIGSLKGESIELRGERETIVGAVVSAGAASWYVKLKGNNSLAERNASGSSDSLSPWS